MRGRDVVPAEGRGRVGSGTVRPDGEARLGRGAHRHQRRGVLGALPPRRQEHGVLCARGRGRQHELLGLGQVLLIHFIPDVRANILSYHIWHYTNVVNFTNCSVVSRNS